MLFKMKAFRICNFIVKKMEFDDTFTLEINDQICTIPQHVAILFSSLITNKIIDDPSIKELKLNIKFTSSQSINKIITYILTGNLEIDENDTNLIFDLAQFGFEIGNSTLITPYIQQLNKIGDLNCLKINI